MVCLQVYNFRFQDLVETEFYITFYLHFKNYLPVLNFKNQTYNNKEILQFYKTCIFGHICPQTINHSFPSWITKCGTSVGVDVEIWRIEVAFVVSRRTFYQKNHLDRTSNTLVGLKFRISLCIAFHNMLPKLSEHASFHHVKVSGFYLPHCSRNCQM